MSARSCASARRTSRSSPQACRSGPPRATARMPATACCSMPPRCRRRCRRRPRRRTASSPKSAAPQRAAAAAPRPSLLARRDRGASPGDLAPRRVEQLTAGAVDKDEYSTGEIGYSLAALIQKLRIIAVRSRARRARLPSALARLPAPSAATARTICRNRAAARGDRPRAAAAAAGVSRFTRNARFLQTTGSSTCGAASICRSSASSPASFCSSTRASSPLSATCWPRAAAPGAGRRRAR